MPPVDWKHCGGGQSLRGRESDDKKAQGYGRARRGRWRLSLHAGGWQSGAGLAVVVYPAQIRARLRHEPRTDSDSNADSNMGDKTRQSATVNGIVPS